MPTLEPEYVIVRGAREHNLKNVTVRIPKHRLVVLTGVSGSGKSSLAFDTLYAEGQRRYVESLSSYARQFLGQMEKPKYDTIRGLSPTISIEQKTASSNPRSTVGTVTEVHDYLRVLYASIGVQHCPICARPAGAQSAQQIVDAVLEEQRGKRVLVMAPVAQQRKGEHKEIFSDLRERGFVRLRVDGSIVRLDQDVPKLDKKAKHDIELVVDRVEVKASERARLADSIESALREGAGIVLIAPDGGKERRFSERKACPDCGISFVELSPLSFSFNSPLGFCAECNGLGSRPEMDPELVVPNPNLSIRDGAIAPWAGAMARGEGWTASEVDWVADHFDIDLKKPWNKLSKVQRDTVLYGKKKGRVEWEGLVHQLMRRLKNTTSEDMKQYYLRYFSNKPCPSCHGARLCPESRAVKIHGLGIAELSELRVEQAAEWIRTVPLQGADAQIALELKKEISARLGFLVNVGLGYLTLDRAAATLSGGESQRIRLASQIGSELTGVIYILDEPSIGLHQRDNRRLLDTLKALRDLGNSVLVVEHDEETMRESDHLIDFGPGAGELGGQIVAQGTPAEVMRDPNSLTGAYLAGRRQFEIPRTRRPGNGHRLELIGASEHNLQNLDVRFPLGKFIAVTGVSGAGKSTLINGILAPALGRALMDARQTVGAHRELRGLEHVDKAIVIDQKPIGRTPRSNPATYTKVFDSIRDLYASIPEARAFGYDAGRFSFNVKGGRCEACAGDGLRKVEMHFLPDVYVTCEVCKGRRFNDATLRVTYKGKSIADTLEMSVREGLEHFAVHSQIVRGLATLADVGLGYVKIGQPSPTLSGGEAQRIKLARELSRVGTGRTVYILDEPTTGLHFADVERLLGVLGRLVDAGNTLIVIEHNLDVIAHADWVIDLGPEGGSGGGRVVAEGTPEDVASHPGSHTGEYLAKLLSGFAKRTHSTPSGSKLAAADKPSRRKAAARSVPIGKRPTL
ncbi:MAG TPA: excinuclease ABC subunit UvrA [Polyangiaceae bacterium]